MTYRESDKPREPVIREPVRWHRWALAASIASVLAAAVASDLGVWASMPATGAAVSTLVFAGVVAAIFANLNAASPSGGGW